MTDFVKEFKSTMERLSTAAERIKNQQIQHKQMSSVLQSHLVTITKSVDDLGIIDEKIRVFLGDSTEKLKQRVADLKVKEDQINLKELELRQCASDKAQLDLQITELEIAAIKKSETNAEITDKLRKLEEEFELQKTKTSEELDVLNKEKLDLEEEMRRARSSAEIEIGHRDSMLTEAESEIQLLNKKIEQNASEISEKKTEIEGLNNRIAVVQEESAGNLKSKQDELDESNRRSQELQNMSAEELRTKMQECERKITDLNAEKTKLMDEKQELVAEKERLSAIIKEATITLVSVIDLIESFEREMTADDITSSDINSKITEKLAEQTDKLKEIMNSLDGNYSAGIPPLSRTASETSLDDLYPDEPRPKDTENPMRRDSTADDSVTSQRIDGRKANNLLNTFFQPKKKRESAQERGIREANAMGVPEERDQPRDVDPATGVPVNKGGTRRRRRSTNRRRRSTKRKRNQKKRKATRRKRRKQAGGYTYSAKTSV
jgi:myosin heavy subunit